MINTQPKAKKLTNMDGLLEVHSIFNTIQGEGPFAGVPAVFIRLAGCNLDCPWCDTIYTGPEVRTLNPFEIIAEVAKVAKASKLIVITGGEPFRQDFGQLVKILHKNGYAIQIETNGTLFVENFPYVLTTVVCSPKLGKINRELIPYIGHYKYVAEAGSIDLSDGLPIEVLGNKVRSRVARPPANIPYRIYLQPMDCQDPIKNAANLQEVVKSCQTFGYALCIQIHKIIGVE